jgi:hypothetical protein
VILKHLLIWFQNHVKKISEFRKLGLSCPFIFP